VAFVATTLVNGEDENLIDKVKDAIDSDEAKDVLGAGDGALASEFLGEFISEYKQCWIEWNDLHGYTGAAPPSAVEGVNDDLRMAYEALSETLTLGGDGTSTMSVTFGSEERAKYVEECNKIEGTIVWDYPNTTLTCENDEGSTSATVALWADCYPDSEACHGLDEKGDAINEGVLKVMWNMGNKCTFDGTQWWDLDEETIASGENPYDPTYIEDNMSTGATPMKMLGLAVTAVLGLMMIS